MERYGLPLAFAAALHGAILFGFNCRPTNATPAKADTGTITCVFPLPPLDEPEPIVLATDLAEAMPTPDAPQPVVGPELPAMSVDKGFTIDPPKIPILLDPTAREIIPTTSPGIVGGIGEKFKWGTLTGADALDRVPTVRYHPSPVYPHSERESRTAGEVLVEFVVDERGDVVQARIVRSTAYVFEEPSLRAVMRWKFEPGRRNNRVVPFRMAIPIVFSLTE